MHLEGGGMTHCSTIIPSTGKRCKYRGKDNGKCKIHGGETDSFYNEIVNKKIIKEWQFKNPQAMKKHRHKYQSGNKEYFQAYKWIYTYADYAESAMLIKKIKQYINKGEYNEDHIKKIKDELDKLKERFMGNVA